MSTRYGEIADDLRKRIASGEFPPGSKLPPLAELMGTFNVSSTVMRDAYTVLEQEGLVDRRGRGGIVVKIHPDQVRLTVRDRQIERDELGYYSGPQVQHWRALPWPDGERTRTGLAPAPADVAEMLGVEVGSQLTVRRRLVGDPDREEHRQLADSWIPAWVTEEVPALSGPTGLGGMYDRVEEWTGKPLRWSEEASTRMPSPAEAEALRMPKTGVPMLRVVRLTSLAARGRGGPRVVEVQDIRMSGALFTVRYPLARAASARWPVAPASSDYYSAPTPSPEEES
ncbi:GntR family transcriptional regulator [Streptomyces sp. SID3343]|uniref:GntR family transcriptional regulator n=1 Tax=Streptomyces sp. SID3343 TaxID=2690260 RepID=UPI0031FA3B17